jgi:hypothetical protein
MGAYAFEEIPLLKNSGNFFAAFLSNGTTGDKFQEGGKMK